VPRVARNVVAFTVSDKVYEAKFLHVHAEKGITSGPDRAVVRHVTSCLLKEKGSPIFVRGESRCSMKDTYDWRLGIKQAFVRALGKAGLVHNSLAPEVRAKYGAMMRAFFDEMRRKDYSTGEATVLPIAAWRDRIDAAIVPEKPLTGQMPAYNGHGLGYAGAD